MCRASRGSGHPVVGEGDGEGAVVGPVGIPSADTPEDGVRATTGDPGCGTGGVTWLEGSFGGVVSWKLTWSKLTSPVFSICAMWSRTTSLAWSASWRTRVFSVVARTLATVEKIEPWVTRRMLARSESNC